MAEYMQGELENSGMFPLASILSPTVVLAHAAYLDQSYAQAFHQVSLLCFSTTDHCACLRHLPIFSAQKILP